MNNVNYVSLFNFEPISKNSTKNICDFSQDITFKKKIYYFIQKIALKNNWFIVQHVWGYPKGESSEKVKSFKKYSQYETEIHGPGVGGGEKDSIQEMKD